MDTSKIHRTLTHIFLKEETRYDINREGLRLLSTLSSTSVDILLWLLDSMPKSYDPANLYVDCSHSVYPVPIKKVTFDKALRALVDSDLVLKVERGRYCVNIYYVNSCSATQLSRLMSYFGFKKSPKVNLGS